MGGVVGSDVENSLLNELDGLDELCRPNRSGWKPCQADTEKRGHELGAQDGFVAVERHQIPRMYKAE